MQFNIAVNNPLTPSAWCHMGTAIKHPMPGRVKPSFVIFDIRELWASECPDVKNYKWWLNPAWHRMLYSCTLVAPLQRVNGRGKKGKRHPSHLLLLYLVGGTVFRSGARWFVQGRWQTCSQTRALARSSSVLRYWPVFQTPFLQTFTFQHFSIKHLRLATRHKAYYV